MVGPMKIQDSRGSTIPDPQGSERGGEAHRNTAVQGRIYRPGPRVEKEVQSDYVTREDVKESEFSMLGFQ